MVEEIVDDGFGGWVGVLEEEESSHVGRSGGWGVGDVGSSVVLREHHEKR